MKTSLKFLILSSLIFILGFTGVFNIPRNLFQRLTNPVQYGLYQMSLNFKDGFDFFSNIKNVRNENLALTEERDNLRGEIAKYKELIAENKALKEQLGVFESVNSEKVLLAKVIGLPFDNENSEVLINKGSKDGMKLGSEVIYQNYLVGSVIDVFDYRSTVVFITSPKLSVAVLDQSGENRAKGLVTGNYGTSLIMDRILPDEEIKTGDVIVTSGQDGIFDSGFIVGSVEEVSDPNSSEPLKKAKLKTFINLNKLENVFVVMDK